MNIQIQMFVKIFVLKEKKKNTFPWYNRLIVAS